MKNRGFDEKAAGEAWARIEEAWDVLRRLPDHEAGRLRMQTLQWPLTVRRMFEDAPKGVQTRRPPPGADQIDRMHEVLDWMVRLAETNRDYAKTVWLCCAERRKVEFVAKLFGVDRKTVARWRDNGLMRVVLMRSEKVSR